MKKHIILLPLLLLIVRLSALCCDNLIRFPWVDANHPAHTLLHTDADTDLLLTEPTYDLVEPRPCADDTTRYASGLLPKSEFKTSFHSFFAPDGRGENTSLPLLSGTSQLRDRLVEPVVAGWKIQALGGYTWDTREGDTRSFIYQGIRFQGGVADFRFFANGWKGHFSGDEGYAMKSSLIDGYVQPSEDGDVWYLDNLTGYLSYEKEYLRFTAGRGSFQTGNSIAGSVILSDYANDYGYISAEFALGHQITLFSRQGALNPDSVRFGGSQERFLASHGITFFGQNWRFEFGEQEMYGDRGFDISYMLPHALWRIVEHNLHDRDNAMIFLDGDYEITHGCGGVTRLYGNFLLDEWRSSEIFSNWWGNKWAVQGGISHAPANEVWRITLEGTAVRPWTYSHYRMVNRYTHDGRPLGFPGGSNLVQADLEFVRDLYTWIPGLQIATHHAFRAQGSLGSDVFQNYDTRPKDTANWLEGAITRTLIDRLTLTYHYNLHHTFRLGVEAESVESAPTDFTYTIGWQTIF